MAKVITDNQHYADIAAAIRTKNETETLYKPSEMAPAILEIVGGTGLNFEIVGSQTRPSNPEENTIWIKTNNPIAGWTFDPNEPSTPIQNVVWIKTSTTSNVPFNALEDNGLYVYINSVYQYVSGSWESEETEVFQGGEWIPLWEGELYHAGNEYDFVTGGWGVDGYALTYDNNAGTLYVGEKTSSYLQTNYTSGWNFYMFGTHSLIDLTGVDHIEIDAEYVSGEKLYIYASPSKVIDFKKTAPQINASKSGIINLDVSSIDSAYITIIPYPISSAPAVWRIHSVRCVK